MPRGQCTTAAGYRDAVGDSGRRQMTDVNQNGVELTQTMHFRLRPGMSTLSNGVGGRQTSARAPPAAPAVTTVAKKQKCTVAGMARSARHVTAGRPSLRRRRAPGFR